MNTRTNDPRHYYVFTGTYSPAGQEAIHTLLFDTETGMLERLSAVSGVDNPSFVTIDPENNRLFAVSETVGGALVSYSLEASTGRLTAINSQPSLGDAPCHLSVDDTGKWLLAVNYTSGSVCLFPIQDDGSIGQIADQIQHTGSSIRAGRQEKPHPHSIWNIPGTTLWLVPDLGNDTLFAYRLEADRGKLSLSHKINAAPGSGPRHVDFHPTKSVVYVIDELSSTVSVYAFRADDGSMKLIQTIPTFPDDFKGETWCADIHVSEDGAFLYGSNRGHDSIGAFRIGENGTLEPIGYVSTRGHWPRNFTLVPGGRYLLAANERTNSIVVMELGSDGVPVSTGHSIELEKPVCLKVLPAPQR